jgi:hypothetical protein
MHREAVQSERDSSGRAEAVSGSHKRTMVRVGATAKQRGAGADSPTRASECVSTKRRSGSPKGILLRKIQ